MKKSVKTTTVKPENKSGNIVLDIALAIAAFFALYLTLVSTLPDNAAYYAVLPVGALVAAVPQFFMKKKYAKYFIFGGAALVTVLCIGVGFTPFKNGLLSFINGAVKTINSTRHAGFESLSATQSFGATFLFSTVVAVWFAVFAIFAVKIPYLFVCTSATVFIVLLFIGMNPHYYTAILIVLVGIGLLALHNGMSVKSMCCYLLCGAIVALAALPCYFFSGSRGVDDFRQSIVGAFEDAAYGTSMPNGKLSRSSGMRSSDEVRLKLTISRLTPTLYLRGFVGSELNGSNWSPTDKNTYVENGYQGLLDYIGEGGLPTVQYAEYSNLNSGNNRYDVKVENISADRRYIYVPYTLSKYSVGTAYYDLGLRGGLFTPDAYSYTVFAPDESSERITQAEWVMEDANRTEAMSEYIKLEGQYRAFVYDTYLNLDTQTRTALSGVIGDFETQSINTATQFIRAYFLDAYAYADNCDSVGNSFATQFFGGKINRANAAYFATAATVMFRALGFPARYIEGYAVHAEDNGVSDTLTVSVTGDSTHAWTEVYFDGIGWLPIEVTPTFFTEQAPDVTVDPTNPDIGGTAPNPPSEEDPEPPEEDPEPPAPPVTPPKDEPPAPADGNSGLLVALKVLIPVTSVIAVLLAIALIFVLRRHLVRVKRRKALNADGAQFGRSAYAIMLHDCKYFGGFDSEVLEKLGVPERGTKRFIKIAEQCVYGEYEVSETERTFVMWYIQTVQSVLLKNCGFFRSLYYKYWVGIVI
ncbi:MAG: hypothetical protein J1G05_03145 [Clostridiales bacterium]|nr:hypothetical protein [Clostridiales bacterium]